MVSIQIERTLVSREKSLLSRMAGINSEYDGINTSGGTDSSGDLGGLLRDWNGDEMVTGEM